MMKQVIFALSCLAFLLVGCGPESTKEFNDSVLGGYNPGRFMGFLFWALIGVFITVQFTANRRDPDSGRTPKYFSWRFWFRDNVRRVFFNLACILVALRFSKDVTQREINEFWSVVIGLSFDILALILNNFRLIKLIGTAKLSPGEYVDNKLKEPGDKTIVVEKKEGSV